ncbi:circadian clock KaiB family protein [Thermoleptolyngbya sp. M55_K2018_002]|uniref:circadian clock KaiB family protein n=1 Tax=Thermoleptolyngbya sp. M55_K2018_002 TaxID=2747808 RepID=UPI0019F8B835|nr:circadian clock KaiB family protein [Thermoleptolyngbya sp. M55_K2018_002]HIK40554.1 circadian clock KaiB family protein [Thermoleptolyngbya sp. M55_K2018_002]
MKAPLPELYKGIALFTPGGDLVYCIDPNKQSHWHLHLCAALQEWLDLSEPPLFLVPWYTASIDRWRSPENQSVLTSAEVYPLVARHQAVLNAVFGTGDLLWQTVQPPDNLDESLMLLTYQSRFPELWRSHDLVIRYESPTIQQVSQPEAQPSSWSRLSWQAQSPDFSKQGYVLRLYVSSNSDVTEAILTNLHRLLEDLIQQPYTLKIIDVYKFPELAEQDQVAATPTLVRVWPEPVRRVTGRLEDASRVMQLLLASNGEMESGMMER